MANTVPTLDLVSLDYDEVKASLQAFLASSPEYRSYDFESGGLASLVKVMAYATWKNNFYLNMVASESFLDSAQLRSSITSHAKDLNYVPGSARSAAATVRMTWTGADAQPVYVVRKGDSLSAPVKGQGAVTFTVPENVTVVSSNGFFSVDLTVYEGPYVSDVYAVNYDDATQRFAVTNKSADVSSMTVVAYEDSSLTPTTFTQATSLLGLDENDEVWFLQCAENGAYEVVFGDGVLGRRPVDGSRVVLEYRVTIGAGGNGAKSFSPGFNPFPGDATDIAVDTLSAATGGAAEESNESVRFYAPRHFRTQERAVTAEDYAVLLSQRFPEVRGAAAYGGEDASPPQYGKVFVVVDVSDAGGVSTSRREAYENFLGERASLTIRPVVVEPERSFVALDSVVKYDPSRTPLSPAGMRTIATAAIVSWFSDNVGFGAKLRLSRLSAAIDASDQSVVSNETTYRIYKKVTASRTTPSQVVVNFEFPVEKTEQILTPGRGTDVVAPFTVWSSRFTVAGESVFVADDSTGVVRVVRVVRGKRVYGTTVGTVDYDRGVLTLPALRVDDYDGDSIRFYAKSRTADLEASKKTVLELGDETSVTVETVS